MTLAASAWREAFDGFAAPLPEADRSRRRAHLDRFLASGFPTRREEEWKYTDLSALADRPFGTPSAAPWTPDPAVSATLDGFERIVIVDGVLRRELCTLPVEALEASASDPPGDDVLAHLNRAFAGGGVRLRVTRAQPLQRPVHVLMVTTPAADGRMAHLSHRLELDAGTEAHVLIEHRDTGSSTHFATHRLDLVVGANASLQLARLQREGTGTSHLFRAEAVLARDARVSVCNVDLGGGLVRNDWIADLSSEGAEVRFDGVYAPIGTAHVDNHTRVDHRAPRCTSRELFRGLALDSAKAIFNGKVVVHPGAQKTDSEQRVANLVLSPKAEIDAKPELEIYADDVKCAHGATFGQLDPTALFYLRSRGVPEAQARALLTLAFAKVPLAGIAHPAIRAHLSNAVSVHLGGEPEPTPDTDASGW